MLTDSWDSILAPGNSPSSGRHKSSHLNIVTIPRMGSSHFREIFNG